MPKTTSDKILTPTERGWSNMRDTIILRIEGLIDEHLEEIQSIARKDEDSKVNVKFTASICFPSTGKKFLTTKISFAGRAAKFHEEDEIADPAQPELPVKE